MKVLRSTLLCGGAFGLVTGIVALIFDFGDWMHLLVAIAWGFCIGAISAPEFSPGVFRRAWLHQSLFGAAAGALAAGLLTLDLSATLMVGVIGAFLGWLAPAFLRHLPFP